MKKREKIESIEVDTHAILTDKEKISMLIDGELPINEIKPLIKKIKTNPELRAYWQFLHGVSATLQNSRAIDWLSSDISMPDDYHQKTEVILKNKQDTLRTCGKKQNRG